MSKQHIYAIENDIIDPSLKVIGNICEEVQANKNHVLNLMMSKYRDRLRKGLNIQGGFMNWELILFASLIVVGSYGLLLIWKDYGVKKDEYSLSRRLIDAENMLKKHEAKINDYSKSFELIASSMEDQENFFKNYSRDISEINKSISKASGDIKDARAEVEFYKQFTDQKVLALKQQIKAMPREMKLKIDGEIPMGIGEMEIFTKLKRNKKGEILRYGIIRPKKKSMPGIREAKNKMMEAGL